MKKYISLNAKKFNKVSPKKDKENCWFYVEKDGIHVIINGVLALIPWYKIIKS